MIWENLETRLTNCNSPLAAIITRLRSAGYANYVLRVGATTEYSDKNIGW